MESKPVNYYFDGIWRMDWGMGNPNTTAALIVTLMIAVWGLGYLRWWGFALAAFLSAGLGVCLVHTFSRGGLVAAGVGLAVAAWFAPRPWPKARLAVGIGSVAVLIYSLFFLNAYKRVGQGLAAEDRSISNRLLIWKAAPQMMHDAPGGWGAGNAVAAYMEWYQPLERGEKYRTLVNSHIRWLVEFSWLQRLAYLFGWAAIFLLCWPNARSRWFGLPLGIWLAFATASFFSDVAESPYPWILPLASLAAVLAWRSALWQWPRARNWGVALALPLALCGLLWIGGRNDRQLSVSPGVVRIGQAPWIWAVTGAKPLGKSPGRGLRQSLIDHPGLAPGFVVAKSLPPETEKPAAIVLAGELAQRNLAAMLARPSQDSQYVLLAPTFGPDSWEGADFSRVRVLFGAFSQSIYRPEWEGKAQVTQIGGVGDFFPRWPENVVKALAP
jgi:hypothetical protein